MKVKTKNIRIALIAVSCLVVLIPALWMMGGRLEGRPPTIALDMGSPFIGDRQELSLVVSDADSGLRDIWIGLLKDDKEVVLLDKAFPRPGMTGRGKVRESSLKLPFEPKKLGLSDGKAILRLAASDYSWRRWWHGNRKYMEQEVFIDTQAPEIDVLSRAHYINQGGTGLVIYRTSEVCSESGVLVGKQFFPGRSGFFKDANVSMAFISVQYDQGTDTPLLVSASDRAGNTTRTGFPYRILKKTIREDTLTISDRFLNWKMPEFADRIPAESASTLLDQFLWVNGELRRINYRTVQDIAQRTESKQYWDGVFMRLPKSARKASFADHRKYLYNGRVADRQVHQGIDLASVEHSPVPAANSGKIVFAEKLGIYGKTIVIDHGFGLFSMYSHLSDIGVQPDQQVAKGDRIGHTGRTGLAGGDHLHFGMLVHHTFVNPIEWWDAAWIENNILSKLKAVKDRLGE